MAAQSIQVTADDGLVFEVPYDETFQNASEEERQAIAQRYYNEAVNPVKTPEDTPWYTEVGEYLERNLDVITGPALGIGVGLGVTALTANPPLGIAAGIAAGGGGTYGGVVLSDYIADEEDKNDDIHYKATQAALTSIGIDIATLGLGKIVKTGYFAGKKALGFTPEETAEEIIRLSERGIADAGTTESLRASQQILQQGSETGRTATLLPTQLGEEGASFTQRFSQSIAESGYLSSKDFIKNGEAINEIVSDGLTDIFNRSGQTIGLEPSNIGRLMTEVVTMGKKATSANYNRALDEIKTLIGTKQVATKPLANQMQKFLDDGLIEGLEGAKTLKNLDPETIRYVESVIADLSDVNIIPAKSLIEIEKALSKQTEKLGDFNSQAFNSRASAQLLELSTQLKNTVSKQLNSLSPDASALYSATKTEYAKNMGGILPKINANFINKANLGPNTQGNFEALGNMLLQTKAGGNNDQLRAFFSSIDQAFDVAGKDIAARKAAGEKLGASGVVFSNAKQAKQAIRQGYLKKLFPDLGEGFDVAKYSKAYKSFQDPKQAERLKIVFGEDYKATNQQVHFMHEASVRGEASNFGSLMIQARQLSAAGAVTELAAFGGTAGLIGSGSTDPAYYLGAAAILLTPKLLAKVVVNPAKVNKLLALSVKRFPTETAFTAAAIKVAESIMSDMSEQERNELKAEFRG